jgi:polysaccharide deacetylase 2 family uncharacterized protein YibQ
MNFFRHILFFVSSIVVLLLVGHIIPNALQLTPPQVGRAIPDSTAQQNTPALFDTIALPHIQSPATNLDQSTGQNIADTLSPTQALQVSLEKALYVENKKIRKNDPDTWYLGKGFALVWYLNQARQILSQSECSILGAKEFNRPVPYIEFEYTCPVFAPKDTTTLRLAKGTSFVNNASQISIAFVVDSFDIASLKALNEFTQPYALIVNPFDTSKALFFDLGRLSNAPEILLHLPMEPKEYPYLKPGAGALMIHHTPTIIQELLNKALKQLPQSIGAINYMGSRALSNPPLVRTLIQFLAQKGMLFLEYQPTRHSVVASVCHKLQAPCQSLTSKAIPGRVPAYLTSVLLMAQKTGSAIAVLPLSEAHIQEVQKVLPIAKDQGTKVEKLTNLMNTFSGYAPEAQQ